MTEDKKKKKLGRPKDPNTQETSVIAVRVLKTHKEFIKPLLKEFAKEKEKIKLPSR